ncbi:hypothetical protein RXV86_12385 [Alisedimentitalea sp. MJ-SS2]|uniref:hypothetical protein n=1 Tax=Aliisedimentitalea sp. MJ-SS2 TaxID=3049795 RepID=UPI0029085F21|nr:hypothetical protein [Alisedimentitalea sp. MJ-SS2]MDU8928186.1 hypothetical protein [Alisedimentitalea sp. MJ-SS2]
MPEMPQPNKILEELADRAASQIDRQAPVAFDASYREMIKYHRFLLAINASRSADGVAINYAEIAGTEWRAPHEIWVGQYRRLFERAASRIPDNGDFIRSLAYTPSRLLPSKGDPELTPKVVDAILDLGPIMVHRLEAWVTKRTTIEPPKGESAKPRLSLAGSDLNAYQSVLPNIVGAWESLTLHVSPMFGWGARSEQSEDEAWSSFQKSWPFLWKHLTNTAYSLAVAVWNEDETAQKLFGESLVRWSSDLRHNFSGHYSFRRKEVLFPDVLPSEWGEAREQACKYTFDYSEPPTPDQVFWAIIQNVRDDVVLLTATLMLFWTIQEKQSSNIGEQAARALLRREGDSRSTRHTDGADPSFKSIFLNFIRHGLSGDRFNESGYAGKLESLVKMLDNMTERTIVPGRIYSPSTIQSRHSLGCSVVGILLASVPENGDGGVVRLLGAIAKEVEILPQGDESLRGLISELNDWLSLLQEPANWQEIGAHLLNPKKDTAKSVESLRGIIEATVNVIEEVRRERIEQLPINEQQLESLRCAVEQALLNEPAETHFFHDVEVGASIDDGGATRREVAFNKISKAELTEPPMASLPVNFEEWFVSNVKREAGNGVWNDFCKRDRTQVTVNAPVETEDFWRELSPLIDQVGEEPVLVVSNAAQSRLYDLVYSDDGSQPQLRIEQLPRGQRHDFYIATIEGVDVCGSEFETGKSWLFSARTLRKVSYTKTTEDGNYADLSFELVDDLKVDMRVGFRQKFAWDASPVFEILGPDPEEVGAVPGEQQL